MMIDNFAEKAVAEISQMTDSAAIELKKKDFLYFVRFVLNEEQDLSGLISDYFERRRVDKNFKHNIVVNNLELISNDSQIGRASCRERV